MGTGAEAYGDLMHASLAGGKTDAHPYSNTAPCHPNITSHLRRTREAITGREELTVGSLFDILPLQTGIQLLTIILGTIAFFVQFPGVGQLAGGILLALFWAAFRGQKGLPKSIRNKKLPVETTVAVLQKLEDFFSIFEKGPGEERAGPGKRVFYNDKLLDAFSILMAAGILVPVPGTALACSLPLVLVATGRLWKNNALITVGLASLPFTGFAAYHLTSMLFAAATGPAGMFFAAAAAGLTGYYLWNRSRKQTAPTAPRSGRRPAATSTLAVAALS
ncbi:MAG: hypothetical protein GC131_04785 [Alphaproteobacteria bacterium]|nr:hypothetical protein [Alphaproteobacteria bacterium]